MAGDDGWLRDDGAMAGDDGAMAGDDGAMAGGMTVAGDDRWLRDDGQWVCAMTAKDEGTAVIRACLGGRLLLWLTHACGDLRSLERCSLP